MRPSAARPISSIGCRTAVTGGSSRASGPTSSKVTIETSLPTLRCRSRNTSSRPHEDSSLAAKTPVTSGRSSRIDIIAARPCAAVYSPNNSQATLPAALSRRPRETLSPAHARSSVLAGLRGKRGFDDPRPAGTGRQAPHRPRYPQRLLALAIPEYLRRPTLRPNFVDRGGESAVIHMVGRKKQTVHEVLPQAINVVEFAGRPVESRAEHDA